MTGNEDNDIKLKEEGSVKPDSDQKELSINFNKKMDDFMSKINERIDKKMDENFEKSSSKIEELVNKGRATAPEQPPKEQPPKEYPPSHVSYELNNDASEKLIKMLDSNGLDTPHPEFPKKMRNFLMNNEKEMENLFRGIA